MFELSTLSLSAVAAFGGKMLAFLIGLAALIFVHELGHFLAARRCGVVVEKFSIGFGKKIFGTTRGETEYIVAAIPLGGYVKMKGEELDEETNEEGSFSAALPSHRLLIAFAGPLFNILFALAIYIFVYMGGVEALSPVIGTVKENSPAQVAGLQTGDQIIAVGGKSIRLWDELQNKVYHSPGKELDFQVERQSGQIVNIKITPIAEEIKDPFGDSQQVGLIGITPLVNTITYIKKGSAAEKAGLQLNDRIMAVGNTPIFGWTDLRPAAVDEPGVPLVFKIGRNGTEILVPLTTTPKIVRDSEGKELKIGEIGVGMSGKMVLEQYGLLGSIVRSIKETWKMTSLIAISVQKMIFGSIPADQIGGPILIFQIYGEQAEQGFSEFIRLTALLSINLGLINLLPIPILDGGHIFFFLIEMIKGRPVSEMNRERAQQVGLFMLISLMVFAFYNDIMRIIN
ncbi:MAG: RIP metalloprotease RseP [Nitrospinaceae bacterium]|jgi:regulator of sigma E protease|nr:RIP metalloprotease RseP [Nitrospinaceae bacterium]MDP6711762.1 RIP metalloprotease RseP [Nitrospinaceae bacterium]HAK37758.1 RIP metalloprotease RseP [Nitrospina sp.]